MINIKEKQPPLITAQTGNNNIDGQKFFKFGEITNFSNVTCFIERAVVYSFLNQLSMNNYKCFTFSSCNDFNCDVEYINAIDQEVYGDIFFDCYVDFEDVIGRLYELEENSVVLVDSISQYYLNKKPIDENSLCYCISKLAEVAYKNKLLVITIEDEKYCGFGINQVKISSINDSVYLRNNCDYAREIMVYSKE